MRVGCHWGRSSRLALTGGVSFCGIACWAAGAVLGARFDAGLPLVPAGPTAPPGRPPRTGTERKRIKLAVACAMPLGMQIGMAGRQRSFWRSGLSRAGRAPGGPDAVGAVGDRGLPLVPACRTAPPHAKPRAGRHRTGVEAVIAGAVKLGGELGMRAGKRPACDRGVPAASIGLAQGPLVVLAITPRTARAMGAAFDRRLPLMPAGRAAPPHHLGAIHTEHRGADGRVARRVPLGGQLWPAFEKRHLNPGHHSPGNASRTGLTGRGRVSSKPPSRVSKVAAWRHPRRGPLAALLAVAG